MRMTIVAAAAALYLAAAPPSAAQDQPIAGQRVFSAGHSFHMFMPGLLAELAKGAGVDGHRQVGTQGIGGSRVIQHWDLPDDRNRVRPALAAGEVDVLTLSPIYLPDEGIEKLAQLALEKNPAVRVTIQEFWLPYDVYNLDRRPPSPPVDRAARTLEQIQEVHAPYFKAMDEHVRALNEKFGKTVLYVVPVGQAVIKLRGKIIAGQAPGLKSQEDLFTDAIGHAAVPMMPLNAYCHWAVIYRRSPVGLPLPAVLARANNPDYEKLNGLLQQLAWEAVLEHPLSGVKPPAER